MHLKCTNGSDHCATCQVANKSVEILIMFYIQYSSCYTDFSSCIKFFEKEGSTSKISVKPKTWLVRDLIDSNYARTILLTLW